MELAQQYPNGESKPRKGLGRIGTEKVCETFASFVTSVESPNWG